MDYDYGAIAKMIDHSLLGPATTVEQLEHGCRLAVAYDVASVCILPYYLKRASEILSGSTVQPSTTIGFPHGGHTSEIKRREAERAIADGCQELDMVVNVSQVRSGLWDEVTEDIRGVIQVARDADRKVKVIFENCYLSDDEKIRLCEICTELQADWVKTSTGYGTGGATMDDLRLMRQHAGEAVQVKAAGGIRDLDTLLEARAIGATRIGASGTAAILDECRRRLGLEPIEFTGAVPTPGGY